MTSTSDDDLRRAARELGEVVARCAPDAGDDETQLDLDEALLAIEELCASLAAGHR